MALQAQSFQDVYWQHPDATFTGYGEGLIQAIIEIKDRQAVELGQEPASIDNGRVSFIHRGGEQMASYRYRTAMPAAEIGASVNDLTASTLVFSKPQPQELMEMARAKRRGQRIIVDFCDPHFDLMHYQQALLLADEAVCPTLEMASVIATCERWARKATIIPDPWEFPLAQPHFGGNRLLWFGHAVNRDSLERIRKDTEDYPLRVVSNFHGAIPWSHQTMLQEFAQADVVLMPKTEDYKSANRTVEALRQGCFVIAEPHPAIMDIPGIYIGGIKEGLEWLKQQSRTEVNGRISSAASYVTEKYHPATIGAMWKSLTRPHITSDQAAPIGPDGPTSIAGETATLPQTYAIST
jgi:hypothetical protein